MERNKNLELQEKAIEEKRKQAFKKAEEEAVMVQRLQTAQLQQAAEQELQRRIIVQAALQKAQLQAAKAKAAEDERKKKNPARKLAKKVLWWTAGIPSGMGIISILSGEPSVETASLPIEFLKNFLA